MKLDKIYLRKIKEDYLKFVKKQESFGDSFKDKLGQLNTFYLPISEKIYKKFIKKKKTIIVGLSGGQGSGKTTISHILKNILMTKYNLNVVSFSIDDFYKTFKERKKMSKMTHKLFLTRGVPGTHDILLLSKTLKKLTSNKFKFLKIPRFDKSIDDRLPKKKWIKIQKMPDIVIFEGWCVGASAQTKKNILKPLNELEKKYDQKSEWRKKVNSELKTKYAKIFGLIDILIFLRIPDFKYVFKWRLLQEKKLKSISKGKKTMNKFQIKNFIMFYERITKQMIKDLTNKANIVLRLGNNHKIIKKTFN